MLSLRSTRFSQLNAILEDQHYVYGCRLRLSRDPTRTVQTEDARCPLMRTLGWSQEFGSPQRRHQHNARVASSLASTTSTHFSSCGKSVPNNDGIKPLTTQQLQRRLHTAGRNHVISRFLQSECTGCPKSFPSKETHWIFRSGILMRRRPFGRLFAPIQVGAANRVVAC